MPSMNAPVRASIRINSLVAGDGHGCGVAVIGPHEGHWNDPDNRTAQTRVFAATIDPAPASAPYVESFVDSTVTGIVDPALPIAIDAAASDETGVTGGPMSGIETGLPVTLAAADRELDEAAP